jgi:hydroxyacylglutathione hydrolase
MKIYFHLNLSGFSNCYIIVNENTKEALIIDPGKITPEIIEHIETDNYKLTGVLVTHNHESHTNGIKTLLKIYTPVIYAADSEIAGNGTVVLKGDGVISIAGLTIGYMSLPGHTPDSMVFKVGRILFTGDSISSGKIGSTSSNYSKNTLISNIKMKILSQQEDTVLMPGHGPPTTVGAEKLYNPVIAQDYVIPPIPLS